MRALIEGAKGYEVVLVASNNPAAAGLDHARSVGIPTWTYNSKGVPRAEFDSLVSRALRDHRVGTVALAGYMRLLSKTFVDEWSGRVINIHPSLLPKYPGLDTHARALAAGDKTSGCTVHFVTEDVDAGAILGQVEVPIEAGDTPATLEQRVLVAEHELYPRILSDFVRR
jgi:phosphoribosylglycinamide formyltransferase-1